MPTHGQHNIKNTHYDQFLTNISVSYTDTQNFIGEQVVPIVEVQKQSDKYMVFDYQDHMVADDDIRRAPGTVASEMRTGWSEDAYYAEGYAKRYALYDEEIANADEDAIFNLKEMAAKQVKAKLLLNKEINTANLMTNQNNFHKDLRVSVGESATADLIKWSDYENSDPMKDVFKLREKVERLGGMDMNTLVLSKPVYNILKFHPKLKSTLAGFTSPEMVSDEAIKQLLGVDNLIVANARRATSNQRRVGQGGMTNYIWGNNAVLMYLPKGAARDIPAAAYTYQWTNPQANVVGNQKTREYYSEDSKTLWIETEEWYGQKITSDLGAIVLPDIVNPLT
ncbi:MULTISPECIES: hypothetical protein [Bacteria]|uniref:Major capsid protein E n=1 Tax=Bacillus spizizenii TaxID=96241 RepID=A0A9Q4DKT4_BACSC|nr:MULTISPECIES: hypothetical protein [Bacillus subtilis group]MCY8119604.1 hypothetical protein [Bacillus spizizenii]MCY8155156.1 hypothetical protein [Bacillus spizizenii]MCY8196576.1 hypothetical protein [Bacillus spizizenii]MCY8219346.1 hypothetical protein [Bacillus spizizenii]MCY8312976.1 hypothetical protein [Bacillus spizizenii]